MRRAGNIEMKSSPATIFSARIYVNTSATLIRVNRTVAAFNALTRNPKGRSRHVACRGRSLLWPMPTFFALESAATHWDSAFIVFLKLTIILFLVLLNGFFVASEFAIVKVRSSQLDALIDQGVRSAKFARHVTAHLDAYLSATQLGITLTSLALGWLGEEYLAHIIQPIFFRLGVTSQAVIHWVSIALAFTAITFLHIVLGELAPKSLAIRRPVPTALWAARPLDVFYVIFLPAISMLNGTANWLLRRFLGIEPAGASMSSRTAKKNFVSSSPRASARKRSRTLKGRCC